MTAATTPVAAHASAPTTRFRGDIQGLRAVAVGLVLLYHAGVPFLPGGFVGVDVFFVISGFLITGLIVREVERTGRLSLSRFYARRAKRLLPATAVVFVTVAALTLLFLPVTRWRDIAGDIAASSVYLVNWRLADRSVDYLAAESAASPLQHFWSLAVEEQFYIVWPLLIVALFWRWRRGSASRRLLLGLAVIAVPSFVWSVHLTTANPGAAYFVTTTRLWEMAVGAVLAVGVVHADRLSPTVRTVLGWAGLAAIGYAALTFDASTTFPGAAALVPTLGAAAVLLAGSGDGRGELGPLTATPMQHVGAWSYSLYLWHWPLIVVATAVWGADGTLPVTTGLLVVTASVLPAWLTYRLVERPFHQSPRFGVPWRAGVLGLVCVAVGLTAAGLLAVASTRASVPEGAGRGAAVLGDDPAAADAGEPEEVTSITPPLADAPDDVADVYGDGCHQDQRSAEVTSCVYGDTESETVIALVGDSHAAHWQPTLEVLAEENGWRLETYTKSACIFADVLVWSGSASEPYVSCQEWQDTVREQLTAQGPDVVVVSTSGAYRLPGDGEPLSREESLDGLAEGSARNWRALEDAGVDVLTINDTPRLAVDAPECVAEHLDDIDACAIDRDAAMSRSGAALLRTAAEQVPEVDFVDLTEYVCPRQSCVPVVGGVLTFSDAHHLTATYARTLAPRLAETITPLLAR
ncbi:Peptidoglycan/LPS O-acetylase OafA/YrhL, contains acyltransferase and SGNH-hydrolase domains [Georgenia satyanarayanai]|uniref:Peptidoglycan/LPS O-acetylase OafA/YrhL, contains acyltransferase and SGNH-hydrolase domains n=1 Tax=Georgenia satyanarayanai TaxID=860221 RepID=A0A2Y9BYU6_9MICO|nr:acyltransferase family protein [Georgenia satyanarayanai]PYF99380.1 peptidoglycan/LPS O-acetylase OafA/YrhL [Georgenia satyanarayanai]SSA43192.1 Peptidoglycan/LPS O-acetylase OafA/YrhL, contains acyltransferase and SGNH-hydrolase domains [Georgenia satyanarayanai]